MYNINPYQMPNFNYSYPQKMEIIHVSGKQGAEQFKMLPNSNALLLDDTQPVVWLSKTDGTGLQTLIPYDITEHIEKPPVRLEDIEARLNNIERMLYHESNESVINEQNQSTDSRTGKADSLFTESSKAIADEYDRKPKSKRAVLPEM